MDQMSYRHFGQDQISIMHFFNTVLFNNLNAGSKEENKTVFAFHETAMLKRLTINMSKRFYNSDNNSAMRERVVGGLDSTVKLANLDSVVRKGLSGSE